MAFRIFALALLAAAAGGCADPSQNSNQSTIPWNRPQSWEGSGSLGGFQQQNEGSTGH